ncbi:hypothetical protein [Bacillus dakarensis]|uniref:hypothetical protein n=1 Tax=Robertmurraya dakarensis TaxID=1926278 RepID=UPI000981C064|nr:hypothetical protein [Bacillus dakarensis]
MITKEMLQRFEQLNLQKKKIDKQLNDMKKVFNDFFDQSVGENIKGEFTIEEYQIQRQVRKTEKFEQEKTIKRLEDLNMMDLIQKRPDEDKIKSALNLGLLKEEDIKGCLSINTTKAIYVKKIE